MINLSIPLLSSSTMVSQRSAHLTWAVLISLLLSGCLGAGPSFRSGEDPSSSNPTVTDPRQNHSAAANRSHVHDLWGNRTTRLLFEGSVQIRALERGSPDEIGLTYCEPSQATIVVTTCYGRTGFRPVPGPDLQDRPVVPPGTDAVHVKVSWDDPAITGVHVTADPAYVREQVPVGTANESGRTLTLEASKVDGSWSMFPLNWTDNGHAKTTRWTFGLRAASAHQVALADGNVTLEIRLERGEGTLPIEPPHPDWYAATSAYNVGSASYSAETRIQAWTVGDASYLAVIDPTNPVPPGTEQVTVIQDAEVSSTTGMDTFAPEFSLSYGTGIGGEQQVPPAGSNGSRRVWEIPVEQAMTDSVYSCPGLGSNWIFLVDDHPRSLDGSGTVAGGRLGVMVHEGSGTVSVVASEVPGRAPTELHPTSPETVEGCKTVEESYS